MTIQITAIRSLQSQAATTIFDTHTTIVHWKPCSQIRYRTVFSD